ncbi:MAG: hypothetical protein ACRDBM_05255 [Sporomusa sp.]
MEPGRYQAAYSDMQQSVEHLKLAGGDPILLTGNKQSDDEKDAKAQGDGHSGGVIGGICFLSKMFVLIPGFVR